MSLTDKLIERAWPDTLRQGRCFRLPSVGSVREEVTHCRSMLPGMSQEAWEPPLHRPVLPGTARTDYERYLNMEELLALQKGADEWVHRDELLFQVVHQSSELWLKLCWNDTAGAAKLVGDGDIPSALRLLGRASRRNALGMSPSPTSSAAPAVSFQQSLSHNSED